MSDERDERIVICIPIFNDWACAKALIEHIDRVIPERQLVASVLLVDDGSTDEIPESFEFRLQALVEVAVLKLRRNVGHQRSIALGLTFIYAECPCRAVIVMDGDGEDSPEDFSRLLNCFEESGGKRIIFAQRARRSEGIAFRCSYRFYKLVHWLLTGRRVEVGNFSIIPAAMLDRLVGVSELWNHYAASVFKARLPVDKIPIARAHRLHGQSKMNFVALAIHGLSAISVFGEQVATRLLVCTSLLIAASLLGLLVVLGIRLGTKLAIPGWTTYAAGSLATVLLNALLLSLMFILSMLQARNGAAFLPLRDYRYYLRGVLTLAVKSQTAQHTEPNTSGRLSYPRKFAA